MLKIFTYGARERSIPLSAAISSNIHLYIAYMNFTHNCGQLLHGHVRFEVFTAVTMKTAIFWDMAPCKSCVN
jgi:Tfp pilus assembly protein PilZ